MRELSCLAYGWRKAKIKSYQSTGGGWWGFCSSSSAEKGLAPLSTESIQAPSLSPSGMGTTSFFTGDCNVHLFQLVYSSPSLLRESRRKTPVAVSLKENERLFGDSALGMVRVPVRRIHVSRIVINVQASVLLLSCASNLLDVLLALCSGCVLLLP